MKKGKVNRIHTVLGVIQGMSIFGIVAITFLACIWQGAETTAGNEVLQKIGIFINQNSRTFFLIVLLLGSIVALVSFAKYVLKNRVYIEEIKAAENYISKVNNANENNYQSINARNNQLQADFLRSSSETRVFATRYLARIRQSCQEVEKTYTNNYHFYHKTQAELDDIIRHTHLRENAQIKMLLNKLDTIRGNG